MIAPFAAALLLVAPALAVGPASWGEGHLHDPAGLLPAKLRQEREAFLAYHAADSAVELRVLLVPPAALDAWRDHDWSSRWSERPTLVLAYPYGEPGAAELLGCAGFDRSTLERPVAALLDAAIDAARREPLSASQFEAFCVQASIRCYEVELALAAPVAAMPSDPASPEASARRREEWRAFWERRGGWLIGGAVGALILGLAGVWSARRARHRFPEIEVPTRLGGDHAAGIGAVISFGDTTQSASAQRQPNPDYLGGL